MKVELGAALFSGAHDGWAHHPLSFTEIPTALHTHALVHPALHAQLPVSIVLIAIKYFSNQYTLAM
jgi:hypothetical protein